MPSQERVTLMVGTFCDVGIARKQQPNEDSLFALHGIQTYHGTRQPFAVFIVADGMGGHAHGQEASGCAIQSISNRIVPPLLGNAHLGTQALKELLKESVQRANHIIYEHNQQNNAQNAHMGTTVTAALIVGSTAYLANVGDSRAYHYRNGEGLRQVTQDHSVVARLVETGKIIPDDIYTHPMRNQIYRYLGAKESISIDLFTVPLHGGDRLLLCSDGLWEMINQVTIKHILNAPVTDPTQTAELLLQAALKGGGTDNISAIVVWVL